MKKLVYIVCFVLLTIAGASCGNDLVTYRRGDMEISLEAGEAYLHDYPLFLGLKKKNPPQIAVWIEDEAGNYLSTVYVTHKIAAAAWQQAGGNRRKEALPHWCYARGVQYADGLYMPTRKEPFTDGLTGATPKQSFQLKMIPHTSLSRWVVKVEVNHSTDFNDFYPESADPGDAGYSGGKGGSGQPAVVYAARIDLASGQTIFEAGLVGHSSPDGSGGTIDPDVSRLTSALRIFKRITITLKP